MGGVDRSEKARENIGNGGGLVNRWKHVDMKVPRKIERCNFQNRNFNLAQIGNLVFVVLPEIPPALDFFYNIFVEHAVAREEGDSRIKCLLLS